MLKVLSILGTRPEAVKMAPILQALAAHGGDVQSIVCSTGQHREMLKQVLDLFDIRPDYELDVMQPDQTLAALTSALITALDRVVSEVKPTWILAQGDTTTVLAASLVAFYHHVSFGHVEAGLRTHNKYSPYPEEVNRRIADLLADAYFVPTNASKANLLAEGIDASKIHITGNTVVDALLTIEQQPFDWDTSVLKDIDRNQRTVLVTMHRRESFGDTFRDMCWAIRDLARRFPDVTFVYPVHLNPNVRQPVQEILRGCANILLLEPLDYPVLIQLIKRSTLVLTDSGGIQEEAPSFRVPTLVLRDTTERPEGIDAGVARLVGTKREAIVQTATDLLANESARRDMLTKPSPYGDGKAAERIVSHLLGLPTTDFTP